MLNTKKTSAIGRSLIKLLEKYCDDNIEEFNKLKDYSYKSNSGKDKISKIPTFRDNDKVSDIPYFSKMIDIVYLNFIDNKDITFQLKNHLYRNGTKLKNIQENQPNYFTFSECRIKDALGYVLPNIMELYSEPEKNDELDMLSYYKKDINLGYLKIKDSARCEACDENLNIYLNLESSEITFIDFLSHLNNECPVSFDDNRVITTRVNVSSGKLIFANDMRRLLNPEQLKKIEQKGYDHSISSYIGEKICTESYASHDMVYCFVGNTCPSVFKINDEEIVVGQTHSEDSDEYIKHGGVKQGYICTDLWWFCAIDYDLFLKLSKENGFQFDACCDSFIVDVDCGEYEVNNYFNSNIKKQYYTQIKKVKKLD